MRWTLRFFILCLMGLLRAAGGPPPAQVQALIAESKKLRTTEMRASIAKAEEALALMPPGVYPREEAALLLDLAGLYLPEGRYADALKAVDRGEPLARATKMKEVLCGLLVYRANAYNLKRDHAEAGRLAEIAYAEARAAGDKGSQVGALIILGQVSSFHGDFPKGIQYFHQALPLVEQLGDEARKQTLLTALANFHIMTRDWTKALDFIRQADEIARRIGNPDQRSVIQINMSHILRNLGRQEEMLKALLEAEALARSSGNLRVLTAVDNNLAEALLERKDYRGALQRSVAAVEGARKLEELPQEASALMSRGIAQNRLGQHEAGLASLEESLPVCRAAHLPGQEVELLGIMSEEYAFAGQFQKALDYHRQFKEKSDRLYFDERTKTVQELEARYQSEKQGREIVQLKAESQRRALVRNFSIVGGLLVMALGLALLARYRLLRRSAEQLKAMNDQLEALSTTDPLTGVRNRRYFLQQVAHDTAQADRLHTDLARGGSPVDNRDLIFFLVDLDHFKQVNDTYGHHAGDLVLKQAVARLKAATRTSDEVIRWGGEEFLVVGKNAKREDAPVMAERLRASVASAPFDLGEGRTLVRTCSIGFAAYPLLPGHPGEPAWDAVVDLADQALYRAKHGGRNRWEGVLASPDARLEDLKAHLSQGLEALELQGLCHAERAAPESV